MEINYSVLAKLELGRKQFLSEMLHSTPKQIYGGLKQSRRQQGRHSFQTVIKMLRMLT